MSWKLHWQFIKLKYAERLSYRADFIASVLAMMLSQFIGPLFVGVVYYAGGQFPGWSLGQILLLQGVFNMILGLSSTFFMGIIYHTIESVDKGTFDILLLRPLNPLRLLIMDSFDEEDIGMFIGGVIITIIGLNMVEITGSIPAFLLLSILGFMLYFSLSLIGSMMAIKFVRIWRYYEILDILGTFAKYPKAIYGKTAGILLSTAVPILAASYYPASALLGFPIDGIIWVIIAVCLWVLITVYLWHKTLKQYSGAGG